MTRQELLEALDAASQEGSVKWTVEPDSSGGGRLLITAVSEDGTSETLEWSLTPIGGLPAVPLIVAQGVQLEPGVASVSNPDTSQTGTAINGTLADTGLGMEIRLPT